MQRTWMSGSEGPFVSLLTSEARGAIAVLRVWGAGAVAAADSAFRPHRGGGLAASGAGRPRVGRVGAGAGDEVVALIVDEPPTGPEAEIQCHGGPGAVALVVEALEAAGAARRPAEDWVSRRSPTRLRGRATIDLASAETERTARILLDQANGALDEAIRRIADQCGDEPDAATAGLAGLIRVGAVGTRLLGGWRVALAGRPNVGKSSLLNAVAGFGRAIVSPTPGTTRDVVTSRVAIDGWPVELADTAGLRAPSDPIEAGGVALARARHGESDLVLLVLDRSEPIAEADLALVVGLPNALIVANKADLPAAWGPEPSWGPIATVSAGRGDGVPELLDAIARRLVPDPPPPGSAVPFREEQVRLLSRALRLLEGKRAEAAVRALDRLRVDPPRGSGQTPGGPCDAPGVGR